ncbi:MAG: PaaI family thioesterase [Promethearchaeota archaeon]|nr:MAG: PaaI family thioesterase [Candidatus Lokiarchaeota archaeon]
MSQEKNEMEKRSERMINLFNMAAKSGMKIGQFSGPIPAFSKWLNGKFLSAKRGEVIIEFDVRPEMANPTGLLHGGMQCAMMDDTIGVMTTTLGYKGFLISVDFHVDYLGKVKVGEKVRVKGKMIREGRNIVHVIAELYNMEGDLIAAGNSNLLKTKYKPDFVKAVDKKLEFI